MTDGLRGRHAPSVPPIRERAVVSVQDETWGEAVAAAVVTQEKKPELNEL